MSRTLTAADRSRLIRLASTMVKGSPERRAILAGLKRVAGEEDAKPKTLAAKKKPLIDDTDSKEWWYFVDDTESEIFSQIQDLETEMAKDADGELDEDFDSLSEAMTRWEKGVKEHRDGDPVGFLTSALNVFEKTLAEAKKYGIDKGALRNAEKEFKALKESIEYNTMPSDLG